MVLVYPVAAGLNDVISGHGALGGYLVAAAGAVGEGAVLVQTVVVIRYGALEAGFGVEGVVVNNVHNNRDTRVVERLNHLLALGDSDVAVIGVGGIGALGDVVVLRVIAPVELIVVARLVDGLEVIEGVELNGGHAELLEIVDTGGNIALAVEGSVLLGERGVLAAVRLADAGVRVMGEVLDVKLPDIGLGALVEQNVLIVFPACGVGLVEVADHRALAVDAGSDGIYVLDLLRLKLAALGMRRGDGVGVVGVDDIAGNGRRPDAGELVAVHHLFQLYGAEILGAGLHIGAGGVAVEDNLGRGRRPHLEGCARGRVGRSEVAARVGVFLVDRLTGLGIVGIAADGVVRGCRKACEYTA